MLIAAIDYSISSPAMSMMFIGDKTKFEIGNIQIRCLTDFKVKKLKFELPYFIVKNDYEWKSYVDRWNHIADFFVGNIKTMMGVYKGPIFIAIEGYAYSPNKSLMVNIAENTAILKHKLKYEIENTNIKIYQPKSVKLFVSKNGNSSKEDVYKSICEKLDINLIEHITKYIDKKNLDISKLPIYDISDSLSILYMLYCEMKILNNMKIPDFEYDYLTKTIGKCSIIEEGFI